MVYVLNSVWRFCDERQAATVALLAFTGFRLLSLHVSEAGDDSEISLG